MWKLFGNWTKKAPRKKIRKTPTEKIESAPNPELENVYMKLPGKLIKIPAHRTPVGVDYDKKDIQKILVRNKRNVYTQLHTHPTLSEYYFPYSPISIPSYQDLIRFLLDPKQKTEIIAQRNMDTGKVTGYLFLKKTKKTLINTDAVDLEHLELAKDLNHYDKAIGKDKERNREVLDEFCDKYGLTYRMASKKFWGSEIENKLESRVVAGSIIGILLVILFIGLNNLTGFVVSSTISKSQLNIPSIIILIGLLILIILLRKRHKNKKRN